MAHNDNQHLNDLCEEALVADFLSSLHQVLDFLPCPRLRGVRCAAHLSLEEKRLHKLRNQLWFEELIKLSLIISTRKRQWHEAELEHVVLGLVRGVRSLDLVQCSIHDAFLPL